MAAPSSSSVPDADAVYEQAKADPWASLVLEALHEQDARTYNGQSGNPGALALAVAERLRDQAARDEANVRADERERVARLLEEHVATLAAWPKDANAAIEMVAFLLRLPGGHP
jgi:hypothetical protein